MITYTPRSELCHPRKFLSRMLADLFTARELAWRLFLRNVRTQYRQSLLGYVWAVIPPLVTTLIWVFLHSAGLVHVGVTTIIYPLYVLTGVLLWQVFVDALNMPLSQLNGSKTLLGKLNFPREALIMAGLGEIVLNMGIRIIFLLLAFLVFRTAPPATFLLALAGIFILVGFGLALGLLLAPFGLLYHDVPRALSVITTFWFFATPVVYPMTATTPAAFVIALNPVTPLLVTTRTLMTTGLPSHAMGFWIAVFLTIPLFIVAWILFRLAMPHLIMRMTTR